jgi:hypothetical protein
LRPQPVDVPRSGKRPGAGGTTVDADRMKTTAPSGQYPGIWIYVRIDENNIGFGDVFLDIFW